VNATASPSPTWSERVPAHEHIGSAVDHRDLAGLFDDALDGCARADDATVHPAPATALRDVLRRELDGHGDAIPDR
jgi:hypothetical protein